MSDCVTRTVPQQTTLSEKSHPKNIDTILQTGKALSLHMFAKRTETNQNNQEGAICHAPGHESGADFGSKDNTVATS